MQKFLCVHGHFYQPPRENPWLESLELQDSAAPYHDWNERIAAECYAPNATARMLDGEGRIATIVNTYSRISFKSASMRSRSIPAAPSFSTTRPGVRRYLLARRNSTSPLSATV